MVAAGADVGRDKATTQTVKLTLDPILFDDQGRQVELMIDSADTLATSTDIGRGNDETLLDTAD